jgi:hypothetical protein
MRFIDEIPMRPHVDPDLIQITVPVSFQFLARNFSGHISVLTNQHIVDESAISITRVSRMDRLV